MALASGAGTARLKPRNCSSVRGGLSGSLRAAASISASVMRLSLARSFRLGGGRSSNRTRTIFPSFFPGCWSRGDDPHGATASSRADEGENDAFDRADDALFNKAVFRVRLFDTIPILE